MLHLCLAAAAGRSRWSRQQEPAVQVDRLLPRSRRWMARSSTGRCSGGGRGSTPAEQRAQAAIAAATHRGKLSCEKEGLNTCALHYAPTKLL